MIDSPIHFDHYNHSDFGIETTSNSQQCTPTHNNEMTSCTLVQRQDMPDYKTFTKVANCRELIEPHIPSYREVFTANSWQIAFMFAVLVISVAVVFIHFTHVSKRYANEEDTDEQTNTI